MRILLVTSNRVEGIILPQTLAAEDLHITVAGDAEMARTLLQEHPFDAILFGAVHSGGNRDVTFRALREACDLPILTLVGASKTVGSAELFADDRIEVISPITIREIRSRLKSARRRKDER